MIDVAASKSSPPTALVDRAIRLLDSVPYSAASSSGFMNHLSASGLIR
jgi:hypothetical protein